MRRAIAFSLTMVFSWLLMAPLFAPDAEANLPPCCRRHGKHHCMMRMMMQASEGQRGFTTVTEKCPCRPASTCAVHAPVYKPEGRAQFYADAARSPICVAQTKALLRFSFSRSHQKRGPPAPLA